MAEHAPRRLALTVAPEQAGKTVDTPVSYTHLRAHAVWR